MAAGSAQNSCPWAALDRARAAAMARAADPAPAQKRRARTVASRAALRGWEAAASANFEQSAAAAAAAAPAASSRVPAPGTAKGARGGPH